jgi:hypothetical protein
MFTGTRLWTSFCEIMFLGKLLHNKKVRWLDLIDTWKLFILCRQMHWLRKESCKREKLYKSKVAYTLRILISIFYPVWWYFLLDFYWCMLLFVLICNFYNFCLFRCGAGIATGYGLDDRECRSWSLGRVKNFFFSTLSRPVLVSPQPPIQWVPGAISRGKAAVSWSCPLASS